MSSDFRFIQGSGDGTLLDDNLPPSNAWDIESIIAELGDFPHGYELLVAGDLNADLAGPEGVERGEEIVEVLVAAGLDYILGTDRCLFRKISVRDPRQKPDNYLILG